MGISDAVRRNDEGLLDQLGAGARGFLRLHVGVAGLYARRFLSQPETDTAFKAVVETCSAMKVAFVLAYYDQVGSLPALPALLGRLNADVEQDLRESGLWADYEVIAERLRRLDAALLLYLAGAPGVVPGPRFARIAAERAVLDAAHILLLEVLDSPNVEGGLKSALRAFLEHRLELALSAFEADPSALVLPAIGAAVADEEGDFDLDDDARTPPRTGLSARHLADGSRLAFREGDLDLARECTRIGRRWFPENGELARLDDALRPPRAEVAGPADGAATLASQIWIRENADRFRGRWVAVYAGKLIGEHASLAELRRLAGPMPDGTTLARIV